MIIPDVNLLVYAHNTAAREHSRTKKWWEETINSGSTILLPWIVIFGFVRIVSSPGILAKPIRAEAAIQKIQNILAQHNVMAISPGERHLEILKEFSRSLEIEGRNFTDAQIASITIEHNATLCSNDTDFLKYPGLRLENPLRLKA